MKNSLKKYMHSVLPVLLGGMLFLVTAAAAAEEARDKQVRFDSGTGGTTIKETIVGWESVNYKLRARAGQAMTVQLNTSHGGNYFNIYPPGRGPGDAAMFIGSLEGSRYEGILPTDGEYTVQVYLMRNAARRNEKATYSLKIEITGQDNTGKEANKVTINLFNMPGFRYLFTVGPEYTAMFRNDQEQALQLPNS